jgi:hypothetical protein
MTVAVIRKNLSTHPKTEQWLILLNDKYYVVSHSKKLPIPETLAFAANADGNVTSWADLAGGKNLTHEQVIAQLEEFGERPYHFNDGENGGILGVLNDLGALLGKGGGWS